MATSSATFFRMIGGSFGTAVFGAIYANVLRSNLAPTLASLHGARSNLNLQTQDPSVLQELQRAAPEIYQKVLAVITDLVQTVFLVAVPIAFVAFLLSWLLPELELRKTVQTVRYRRGLRGPRPAGPPCRRFSWPWSASRAGRTVARALPDPGPRAGIDRHLVHAGCCTAWLTALASTVGEVASRLKVDSQILEPGIAGLLEAGMITEVTRGAEGDLVLTPAGRGGHRSIHRSPSKWIDRAPQRLESPGASRGRRDGQGPGRLPPGR